MKTIEKEAEKEIYIVDKKLGIEEARQLAEKQGYKNAVCLNFDDEPILNMPDLMVGQVELAAKHGRFEDYFYFYLNNYNEND